MSLSEPASSPRILILILRDRSRAAMASSYVLSVLSGDFEKGAWGVRDRRTPIELSAKVTHMSSASYFAIDFVTRTFLLLS